MVLLAQVKRILSLGFKNGYHAQKCRITDITNNQRLGVCHILADHRRKTNKNILPSFDSKPLNKLKSNLEKTTPT